MLHQRTSPTGRDPLVPGVLVQLVPNVLVQLVPGVLVQLHLVPGVLVQLQTRPSTHPKWPPQCDGQIDKLF